MLHLLLGQDDFSKKQHINRAYQAQGAGESRVYFADSEEVNWQEFLAQDLFSKPKVFILNDCVKSLEKADLSITWADLVKTPNQIFLCEQKLDKRSNFSKKLLSLPEVSVIQFDLPHGVQFDEWITKRAQELGADIDLKAASLLAHKLGRDDFSETRVMGKVVDVQEVFSLWQADAELRKLLSLADGGQISATQVEELVQAEIEIDALEITNAIAENNRLGALALVDTFLRQGSGTDQKAGVIQLTALLAEQFRNVAIIQDFVSRKMSEDQIIENTGWKKGRVFVMKKIAMRFPNSKVWETLSKFEALDEELKTSSTPPRVLLDLILSQLLLK